MSAGLDARERDGIRAGLASDDDEVRRLAVEQLAALPAEEALPDLLTALGDSSWRVRKSAVDRLVAAPESWCVYEPLIHALGDGENPGRRNAAVEALVHCGARAVASLIVASRSDDEDVRKLVVDALAGIGEESAVPCLAGMLGDADANVRAAAADALGAIGGDAAASALLSAVTRRDDDRLVVFSALRSLARLEVPVAPRNLAPLLADAVLRPAAYAVLGSSDDGESEALLVKGLESTSRPSREAAMAALLHGVGRRDGVDLEVLLARIRQCASPESLLVRDALERLASADLATRLTLIQFLGLLGYPCAVIPILCGGIDEALSEVALATLEQLGATAEREVDGAWAELEPEARLLACELLGRTAGEAARARLLALLDEHGLDLRTAAARALGRARAGEALRPLVRRLEAAAAEDDPDGEEELAALTDAVVAVAESDAAAGGEAVELLGAGLDGAREPVALAIATVLGRIGRPRDAGLVALLLKDPRAAVRRAAVRALARIEGGADSEPVRLALADESPSVRMAAAAALGASDGGDALADLARLAEDGDAQVRAAAIRAIGAGVARRGGLEPGGPAFARLRAALADEAPVALAAAEALRAAGGDAAAEAVRPLLSSDDAELVQAAIGCLGRHGNESDVAALIPLVAHPHWTVRAEAVQVLADRGAVRALPQLLRRLETEQDDFVRAATLRALRVLER